MSRRRSLMTALDAELARLCALSMLALARVWVRASYLLRRTGVIDGDRFGKELGRAARYHRTAMRATAVWLWITRG
jgi:hypothetical protein